MPETKTENRIEELEEKLDQRENPEKHAKSLYNQRYKDLKLENIPNKDLSELDLSLPDPPAQLAKLKAPCVRFESETLATDILAPGKALLNHDRPTLNVEIWGQNGYVTAKNEIRKKAVEIWDNKRKEFLNKLRAEREDLATKIAEKIQNQVDDYKSGDDVKSERFRIYFETFPLWQNVTTTPLGGKAKPDDSELWRLTREVRVNKINTQGGIQDRALDLELDKPWENVWGPFLKKYISDSLLDKATLTMKSFRKLIHGKGEIKQEIARYF